MVKKKKKAYAKKKPAAKRLFGRLVSKDARDKRFRISRMRAKAPRGRRVWKSSWAGDQAATPQCVGFAWSHWLNSQPIKQFIQPSGIYQYAQHVDQWDGTDYDGTSVRAGAKVLQDLGFIESYRWGWTQEDVSQAILTLGPVVIGSNWYTDMMVPDQNGFLHPSGNIVGGHAYLLYGVDTVKKLYFLKNSWGVDWGKNGTALLAFGDLQNLLYRDGEACIGIERKAAPR
jgi:hypothetical protein